MSKRFYVAWALAALLVVVMPIGIPYLVWPPLKERPGCNWRPTDAEVFGCYARSQIEGTRVVPSSVDVEAGPLLSSPVRGCGPEALHNVPRRYTATVTLRGPYGLPLSEYEVTCSGWSRTASLEAGALYSALAFLGGVVVVSVPFFLFWLRHTLSRRLQHAE